MDFDLDEVTTMLRTVIRRFVDEVFRPLLDDLHDDIERYYDLDPEYADVTDDVQPQAIGLPDDARDRLRETAKDLGFWALDVPEEYGGGGRSLVEGCAVIEEPSKHPLGLYQAGHGVIELGPGLAARRAAPIVRASETLAGVSPSVDVRDSTVDGLWEIRVVEPGTGREPGRWPSKTRAGGRAGWRRAAIDRRRSPLVVEVSFPILRVVFR